LTLAAVAACSDAGIQPIDDHVENVVDDLLQMSGSVCTSDPSEAVFPVKILLIVDTSGSMQFTDPSSATNNPGRQAATRKLIDRFKNNPAVSFAIVQFNGKISVNGASSSAAGFTNNPAVLNQAIGNLAQAEITTDYVGALSAAYDLLQRDMFEASPTERVRTKYVVIFFSDGGPNPVCQEGCNNDKVDIGVPVDSWCDIPRDKWCDNFNPKDCKDMEKWYPAMTEPCKAYNTNEQINQKVAEIIDLGKQYSVGEIRLHTAFLYVDNLPVDVQQLMGAEKAKAEPLLQGMAKAGNGLYRSFSSGQEIDFLSINYSTVARPFGMTFFAAMNMNSRPAVNKLLVDSDGDGIDDQTEFDAKLQMKEGLADSDGDGYNDKLEYERRNAGFDPGNPNLPVKVCLEREDLDGDGLNGCEEKILGTDPKIADTDRDRIPDGLEFLWGTNPLVDDAKQDPDFDGKVSSDEVRSHSSPVLADGEVQASFRYIYELNEQPKRPDGRACYDFSVRRIHLVTTLERGSAGSLGFNDVLVYFGEGPADDPRDYGNYKAACVRAQYIAPNYKYPADGKAVLKESSFMSLPALIKARAAAQKDKTKDPCVGAPLP
jgi:uncharacterized protein YegL